MRDPFAKAGFFSKLFYILYCAADPTLEPSVPKCVFNIFYTLTISRITRSVSGHRDYKNFASLRVGS